jgi:hypothetical protein
MKIKNWPLQGHSQKRTKAYQERGDSLFQYAPGFAYKFFCSALRPILKKIRAHRLINDFTR